MSDSHARSQGSKSATSAVTRRQFTGTALAASTYFAAPRVYSASNRELVLGEGEHQFRVQHHWPELPSEYRWQTTHNVAVDKSGNLYVIHEGDKKLTDHPSIFVFDSEGKFIRAFGQQFQGVYIILLIEGKIRQLKFLPQLDVPVRLSEK